MGVLLFADEENRRMSAIAACECWLSVACFALPTLKLDMSSLFFLSRSIRSTVGEKRKLHGYDTLPFGYEGELGESVELGEALATQKVEQAKRTKLANIEKEAQELGIPVESVIARASAKVEKTKEAKQTKEKETKQRKETNRSEVIQKIYLELS